MKNDVIELVTITKTENENGFDEDHPVTFEIMADINSVNRGEFYAAAKEGIEVKLMVSINIDDYEAAVITDGEKKVRPSKVLYDGTSYRILRDYRKRTKVELTLQEVE